MGTPTGGSGMGSIHKQDLKMEKFLGDIGNIKTTHGENTSNVIKNESMSSGFALGAANIVGSGVAGATTSKVISDAVNKMNIGKTGEGKGTTYKSGELEKTASSYTEPKNPADK